MAEEKEKKVFRMINVCYCREEVSFFSCFLFMLEPFAIPFRIISLSVIFLLHSFYIAAIGVHRAMRCRYLCRMLKRVRSPQIAITAIRNGNKHV